MSCDENQNYSPKAPKLTKIEKFESKLHCNWQIYFCFGSTFTLIPEMGTDEIELFYFDFLWFHMVITKY